MSNNSAKVEFPYISSSTKIEFQIFVKRMDYLIYDADVVANYLKGSKTRPLPHTI